MPERPRDNQAGFALTELIVAMTVGLIVLLAAFLLLDRAHGASNEIADRQDAVQRGRQAMELLTRQIRSQVCLGGFEEPITDGTNNSVTFYADLTDGSKNVERRTITFDPATESTERSSSSSIPARAPTRCSRSQAIPAARARPARS